MPRYRRSSGGGGGGGIAGHFTDLVIVVILAVMFVPWAITQLTTTTIEASPTVLTTFWGFIPYIVLASIVILLVVHFMQTRK